MSPDAPRVCGWCRVVVLLDPRARFCSQRCRQSAWRLRERAALDPSPVPAARRIAYADPPYPDCAARYYASEPTYAGEVDHAALLAMLTAGDFDGWALSTSARALRLVLPLCPAEVRVCAWVKPHAVPARTRGLHNAWEPLLVMPARRLRPGVPDHLRAFPARGGGDLIGRKPLAFCAWLFRALGMLPGDDLVDLFPGTGIVGRAWSEVSRGAPGDASPSTADDGASP